MEAPKYNKDQILLMLSAFGEWNHFFLSFQSLALCFVVEKKVLPGGVVLLTLIYCTVSSSSVEVSSFPSPSLSYLFVMSQLHNKIFHQTNNVCQTCPEKYLVNLFHLQFVSFRCVPSSTTNGFERHQIQLSNLIHYHLMIAAGI